MNWDFDRLWYETLVYSIYQARIIIYIYIYAFLTIHRKYDSTPKSKISFNNPIVLPPWACYIVDVPRAWTKVVIGLVGIPKTNSIQVCKKGNATSNLEMDQVITGSNMKGEQATDFWESGLVQAANDFAESRCFHSPASPLGSGCQTKQSWLLWMLQEWENACKYQKLWFKYDTS